MTPWPGVIDERSPVGFGPQSKHGTAAFVGEPAPECSSGRTDRRIRGFEFGQQCEFVPAGARQQCAHQSVFALEQKQQHTGARTDRGGERPQREGAWIATVGGQRVGCVFCVREDATTAKRRILLVDPAARGHHLGARLVDRCVIFARDASYERIRLWTNEPLAAARRIYLAAGFRFVEEKSHRSFGVDLVGQTYELALTQ